MLTAGAKFWYALTGLALAAAAVYWFVSGGEEFGAFVLVFAAIAGAALGTGATALRDGGVPAPAEGETVREAPRVEALPAVWPVLGAVGVVVTVVGLAVGNILLWVGIAILAVTLFEWMVQSWAERSTPEPSANLELRNRIMFPIEIPALAVIGVALVILTMSRMLLALPQLGAVAFASVVALVVLGVAALLATRPRIGSSVLSGAMGLGAVLLIVGGIVGGVVGEREFEHHGPEEANGEEHGDEEQEDEEGPDLSVTPRDPRPDDARRGDDDPALSADETPEEQVPESPEDPAPGDTETLQDPIRTDPDETPNISTP
jgi:hypothetical protein